MVLSVSKDFLKQLEQRYKPPSSTLEKLKPKRIHKKQGIKIVDSAKKESNQSKMKDDHTMIKKTDTTIPFPISIPPSTSTPTDTGRQTYQNAIEKNKHIQNITIKDQLKLCALSFAFGWISSYTSLLAIKLI